MLFVFALPNISQISSKKRIEYEQQQLVLFLKRVQLRASQTREIWYLVANKNFNKQWCLSAQKKSEQVCDCFIASTCPTELQLMKYEPHFSSDIQFYTKNYYPKLISRFSGVRNTFSSACFVLQDADERTVFSLFNVGSLKLKKDVTQSSCIAI